MTNDYLGDISCPLGPRLGQTNPAMWMVPCDSPPLDHFGSTWFTFGPNQNFSDIEWCWRLFFKVGCFFRTNGLKRQEEAILIKMLPTYERTSRQSIGLLCQRVGPKREKRTLVRFSCTIASICFDSLFSPSPLPRYPILPWSRECFILSNATTAWWDHITDTHIQRQTEQN